MCLITYAPKGPETLDWHTLDYSRQHMNDDGFGVAWYDAKSGEWSVMRSLRSKKLRKTLAFVPAGAPVVIHQRYATAGTVSLDNCHPFAFGEGGLLFHNGTISGTGAGSKGRSDTRCFVEDELEPICDAAGMAWLNHPRAIDALEARVDYGNVLTICLPNNPVPVIVNKTRGSWENDLWYSNSYARPYDKSGWYENDFEEDDANRPYAAWYAKKYGEYPASQTGNGSVCAVPVSKDKPKQTPKQITAGRAIIRTSGGSVMCFTRCAVDCGCAGQCCVDDAPFKWHKDDANANLYEAAALERIRERDRDDELLAERARETEELAAYQEAIARDDDRRAEAEEQEVNDYLKRRYGY